MDLGFVPYGSDRLSGSEEARVGFAANHKEGGYNQGLIGHRGMIIALAEHTKLYPNTESHAAATMLVSRRPLGH